MCFSFSLRVTLCPDFLSHLFQSLSQQNIRPSTASSTAAAKAVAPSPSGKGTKTSAVPPLCRVPESSGSSMVVGEVTAGEMNVGSSPGERWADGVGVLEPRPLLWELVREGDGGAGTALFFNHCYHTGRSWDLSAWPQLPASSVSLGEMGFSAPCMRAFGLSLM